MAFRHPLATTLKTVPFASPRGPNHPPEFENFEVPAHYEIEAPIAKGTYGFVVLARDSRLTARINAAANQHHLHSEGTTAAPSLAGTGQHPPLLSLTNDSGDDAAAAGGESPHQTGHAGHSRVRSDVSALDSTAGSPFVLVNNDSESTISGGGGGGGGGGHGTAGTARNSSFLSTKPTNSSDLGNNSSSNNINNSSSAALAVAVASAGIFPDNHPPAQQPHTLLDDDGEVPEDDTVAIKKAVKLFSDPRLWLCATREICLMSYLRHPNIMDAKDVFIPLDLQKHGAPGGSLAKLLDSRKKNFHDVYIVMEYMPFTLRQIMDGGHLSAEEYADYEEKVRSSFTATPAMHLHLDHINAVSRYDPRPNAVAAVAAMIKQQEHDSGAEHEQQQQPPVQKRGPFSPSLGLDSRAFLLYQFLRGVQYLHSVVGIVHRDLKCENVLVNTKWELKICDFGQGKGVSSRWATTPLMPGDRTISDVTTQWYAAPETLNLTPASQSFSPRSAVTTDAEHRALYAADMWGVGCIAAEMILGLPLFPSHSHGGSLQLPLIFHVLGAPTDSEIESLTQRRDPVTRRAMSDILTRYQSSSAASAQSPLTPMTSPGFSKFGSTSSPAAESSASTEPPSSPSSSPAAPPAAGYDSKSGSRLLRELLTVATQDQAVDEPDAIQAEIELVLGLLTYDPRKRLTANEALASPLFYDYVEEEQQQQHLRQQSSPTEAFSGQQQTAAGAGASSGSGSGMGTPSSSSNNMGGWMKQPNANNNITNDDSPGSEASAGAGSGDGGGANSTSWVNEFEQLHEFSEDDARHRLWSVFQHFHPEVQMLESAAQEYEQQEQERELHKKQQAEAEAAVAAATAQSEKLME